MFRLALGTLNLRPDGSNSNSEFSGCRVSVDIRRAFLSTALSNTSPSCLCDLPITFPAVLTILESLFLSLTFRLPYQAVILYCKILSTRPCHDPGSSLFLCLPLVAVCSLSLSLSGITPSGSHYLISFSWCYSSYYLCWSTPAVSILPLIVSPSSSAFCP